MRTARGPGLALGGCCLQDADLPPVMFEELVGKEVPGDFEGDVFVVSVFLISLVDYSL